MSWSTSIRIDAAEDELPVLTDEAIETARESVRTNLDTYSEHDTFDGAVAAARSILQCPGSCIVHLSGHASTTTRQCSAKLQVPTKE